jgi:hypothetical protein
MKWRLYVKKKVTRKDAVYQQTALDGSHFMLPISPDVR